MSGVPPWTVVLSRGPRLSRRPLDVLGTATFVLGGLLLIWSASIHFHLWGETDGYRSIPTIGWLFLLQSIAGAVIGVGLIAVRRLWAALIGAGFALSTLAGFLVSVAHGLFGFKDSWMAPFAQEAFGVELAAAAVLIGAAVLCLAIPSADALSAASPADHAT